MCEEMLESKHRGKKKKSFISGEILHIGWFSVTSDKIPPGYHGGVIIEKKRKQ